MLGSVIIRTSRNTTISMLCHFSSVFCEENFPRYRHFKCLACPPKQSHKTLRVKFVPRFPIVSGVGNSLPSRWIIVRPCPHVSGNFFFRKYFFADAKIFASARSVFESFSAVHTYPIVSENFLICSSAQFFCRRESWNEHAHNCDLGAISFAP